MDRAGIEPAALTLRMSRHAIRPPARVRDDSAPQQSEEASQGRTHNLLQNEHIGVLLIFLQFWNYFAHVSFEPSAEDNDECESKEH
jgi:hypothetical protein